MKAQFRLPALLVGCLFAAGAQAATYTVSTIGDLTTAIGSASAGDTVELNADIDMSAWTTAAAFAGTLDGQGHKLQNLIVPLFGDLTADVTIRDVIVENANLTVAGSATGAGVLANSITAASVLVDGITFTGCTLKNTARAGNVGFVAGLVTTTGAVAIQNCVVDDTCSFTVSVGLHGGMVGNATVNNAAAFLFQNCTMAAATTYTQYGVNFGGIVGRASATKGAFTFIGCTNYTSAAGGSGSNHGFGGIAYEAAGSYNGGSFTVDRCTNYGSYTFSGGASTAVRIAGILGVCTLHSLTMTDCVNYGDLSSTGAGETRVGIAGLVGAIDTPIKVTVSITDSANFGDITGYYPGGLVGTLSHNASYTSTKTYIRSCMSTGALSSRKEGFVPGHAIGYLSSGLAYPLIAIEGGLYSSDQFIGTYAEGATVTNYSDADSISIAASEGLVDGTDLAALNAYNENCDLWKQGHETPILKILPDEAAPDTITVTFKDWDDTVLKQVVIARGGHAFPPADPERSGCTFLGWDVADLSALSADTIVTAQYSSGIITYTVTFLDWDGTVLGAPQEIEHGGAATAPADPVREDYVFTGWDCDFSEILADTVVRATYVQAHATASTPDDLDALLSPETPAAVTVHLAADIALPADWEACDFAATLDGAGHTLSYAATGSLFNTLTGSVRDLVIDGISAGEPAAVTVANSKTFGIVASVVKGGEIRGVTLRNITLSSGSDNTLGLIAGELSDGGVIAGCTTEDSCTLRVNRATAGGIVGRLNRTAAFAPVDEFDAPVLGLPVASILDCTNNAPIEIYGVNFCRVGGIVGADNLFNATYQFSTVISNCVNTADILPSVNTGANACYIGGLVGERNDNDAGRGGVLYITDCANFGDIPCSGTQGCRLGGIVGYFWRGCATTLNRCVNRGDIGTTTVYVDASASVVSNSCGGLYGYACSLYNQNPLYATNCANYGAVSCAPQAGGFVGLADANTGHGDTRMMFYNCANYGAVTQTDPAGFSGQAIGCFNTKVADSKTRQYGCVNCFFQTSDLCGYDGGSTLIFTGNVTAAADGYTAASARTALNAAAAESEGAYEIWMIGRIGPELLPFWDGYRPETLILFK